MSIMDSINYDCSSKISQVLNPLEKLWIFENIYKFLRFCFDDSMLKQKQLKLNVLQ